MTKTQIKDIDELAKQLGAGVEKPEELPELLKGKSSEELVKQREREQQVELLKKQLKACNPGRGKDQNGKSYWSLYESICKSILETVLVQEFTTLVIDVQPRTPKMTGFNIIIRDILIQNNCGDSNSKWSELKSKYSCEEIVFECKNLTTPVKAQHIFQLFLYLTSKIGKFGIILSRNGQLQESAVRAIEKLSKEDYMILVFKDEDLKTMLDNYAIGQNQEQFIGSKIQEHRKNLNF